MDIYKVVDLDFVFEQIDPSQDLAFDTETIGKYGKIRLAQFYQRGWESALIVEYPDPTELLIKFNSIKQCNIVMQYAHYDISTIQELTGSRWIPDNFSDTFLLARLGFPHLDKYSLDDLISYCLDFDPYTKAEINKADMHKADWGKFVLDKKQYIYAALDVYYLFSLYDKVKVQEDSLCYNLDIKSLRCALDFQRNGFAVDKDKLFEHYTANMRRIEEIGLPINCNSWQQVRPYIGSNESDDKALALLSLQGNDKARDVRETRKLTKQNSFINKFDTDDEMIYGKFAPSTRSGRFSCSDQNLQQLPRALKDCFGYKPEDDKVLIYSDYSGLELRCIAAITGEPLLLKLFEQGIDVHNYVAEILFGKNFTKQQRQITKTCNFNLLYGGGAPMLQSILFKDADILLDLDEVKSISRKWKNLFKRIKQWQEAGIRDYHRGSLGSTPFGRRYKGRMMTDQLNIQNQGFGSEVAKLAMIRMYDTIKEYNAQLVNFIHDSYIISMDNNEKAYTELANYVAKTMQDAWFEAIKATKHQSIPMPVEISVGYNWGDIENGEVIYENKI